MLFGTFSDVVKLFSRDAKLRGLIYRPFKKGVKAFFYILGVMVILSYLSCKIGMAYLDNTSIIALFFGNFLILILVPPVLSFLYFSLFCDSDYSAIAKYSMFERHGIEPIALGEKGRSSLLKLVVWITSLSFLFLIAMALSFFVPVIGIVLTGILLVYDFSRYCFNELGLNFSEGISKILDNFWHVLILSGFFGAVCLIPFFIVFIYPFGVLICASYYGQLEKVRKA